MDGQDVATCLYHKSQSIIEQEFSELSDKKEQLKQIDLYKIWHYNNAARATSLTKLAQYKPDKLRGTPQSFNYCYILVIIYLHLS